MSEATRRRHLPMIDLAAGYAAINAHIDKHVAEVVRRAEVVTGGKSPCAPGCAACCRNPVALQLPEAVLLLAAVRSLPAERRSQIRRAVEHWSGEMQRAKLDPADPFHKAEAYFDAGIACPLLIDERCSIYAERPLLCRAHAVVHPAEFCRTGRENGRDQWVNMAEVVDVAVPMLIALLGPVPRIIGRLPVWLLAGWPLVENREEPDYFAWMETAARSAQRAKDQPPKQSVSPMHRRTDPGAAE